MALRPPRGTEEELTATVNDMHEPSGVTASPIDTDALRDSVVRRLAASRAPESWIALVRDGGRLDDADQRRSFGEALPPGLRLID